MLDFQTPADDGRINIQYSTSTCKSTSSLGSKFRCRITLVGQLMADIIYEHVFHSPLVLIPVCRYLYRRRMRRFVRYVGILHGVSERIQQRV